MEDKQLDVFEDRINRAISFIETLKAKEKTLVDAKEDVERKVNDLQEQIVEKDQKIEELLESQVFLKNKIETVLNKLESLANFDADNSDDDEKPAVDDTSSYGYERSNNLGGETGKSLNENDAESSGEIYVEENIVDLKDENGAEQESDQKDTTISTPQVDQSPLFDTTENEQAAEEDEDSEEHDLMKNKEQEHKPFSDNPFIEM